MISKYNAIKKDAKVGKTIRKLTKERDINYLVRTKLGRRLLGMTMVHTPNIGLESMAKMIALASAGTLANLGLDEAYLTRIPLLIPSTNTLKTFLFELGFDGILLTSDEIKNKGLSLVCDKGKDKNSTTSFVKLLCWYDEKKVIEILCLGI